MDALLIPAILAVITGWALVAALLSDGAIEGLAVVALALVAGLAIWKLVGAYPDRAA